MKLKTRNLQLDPPWRVLPTTLSAGCIVQLASVVNTLIHHIDEDDVACLGQFNTTKTSSGQTLVVPQVPPLGVNMSLKTCDLDYQEFLKTAYGFSQWNDDPMVIGGVLYELSMSLDIEYTTRLYDELYRWIEDPHWEYTSNMQIAARIMFVLKYGGIPESFASLSLRSSDNRKLISDFQTFCDRIHIFKG